MTTEDWSQVAAYAGLALAVLGSTIVLALRDRTFFAPYFGSLNPLLVMAGIILTGGLLLAGLTSQGRYAFIRAGSSRRFLVPAAVAILLGIVIVLVDRAVVFPEDMNVRFPESVLFYPVMGFVVEILFHVLPLAILLYAATKVSGQSSPGSLVWALVFVVALIEPTYQTLAWSPGQYPPWATVYVFIHIFLINVVGLTLFTRFDFVSMYAFRLMYYALWHIVWGQIRLGLLF